MQPASHTMALLFQFNSKEIKVEGGPYKLKDRRVLSIVDDQFKVPKNLKYYREPKATSLPFNLNDGYENYIHRENKDDEHLSNVLHYIMHQGQREFIVRNLDFCTSRQSLLMIMLKTRDPKYKWMATKFKGCIYLDIVYNDESTMDEMQKRRSTYQFKMRQFVFADSPNGEPNTTKPINENEQLYGTFSANLGSFRLMYSAEIPGVENRNPLDDDLTNPKILAQCKPISIKIFKETGKNLWLKKRQWVSQAYLVGIERLKIGIFDNSGLVRNAMIDVQCADQYATCKIDDQLQFLHRFLTEVGKLMANVDCPKTVYLFSFVKNESIIYEKHVGENEYSFLKEDYIEFVNESI